VRAILDPVQYLPTIVLQQAGSHFDLSCRRLLPSESEGRATGCPSLTSPRRNLRRRLIPTSANPQVTPDVPRQLNKVVVPIKSVVVDRVSFAQKCVSQMRLAGEQRRWIGRPGGEPPVFSHSPARMRSAKADAGWRQTGGSAFHSFFAVRLPWEEPDCESTCRKLRVLSPMKAAPISPRLARRMIVCFRAIGCV